MYRILYNFVLKYKILQKGQFDQLEHRTRVTSPLHLKCNRSAKISSFYSLYSSTISNCITFERPLTSGYWWATELYTVYSPRLRLVGIGKGAFLSNFVNFVLIHAILAYCLSWSIFRYILYFTKSAPAGQIQPFVKFCT